MTDSKPTTIGDQCAALLVQIDKLAALLRAPEYGLGTWHGMTGARMCAVRDKLIDLVGPPGAKVAAAAPAEVDAAVDRAVALAEPMPSRCTCGSGAHPRRCGLHPDAYDQHIAEYNAADREAEPPPPAAPEALTASTVFDLCIAGRRVGDHDSDRDACIGLVTRFAAQQVARELEAAADAVRDDCSCSFGDEVTALQRVERDLRARAAKAWRW